jgi:hypothetical protein
VRGAVAGSLGIPRIGRGARLSRAQLWGTSGAGRSGAPAEIERKRADDVKRSAHHISLAANRTQGAAFFHLCSGEVRRLVGDWDRELGPAGLGLAPEPD